MTVENSATTPAERLLPGIVQHTVETPRLRAAVLERPGTGTPVVFVHGNVSSSLFWQPAMLALESGVRAVAVDLRGFGDSETLPVDATRGLRDYAEDVESVLDTLGIDEAHLVGWSMGGGVTMQMLLDRPTLVRSLTLVSPVSPYGFGATRLDGSLTTPDAAGSGGGGANPDFVARLQAGDRTAEAPTSPRSVFRSSYVHAAYRSPLEDLWVESMLSTSTSEGNYPGDSVASENWPGFAPGRTGVLNTMAPQHLDLTGIVDVDPKPRIAWVHGLDDAIVSDTSFFDLNHLGQLGVIPGWPGEEEAPAQPMKAQIRAVLGRYEAAGGEVVEEAWASCGHSPHLEHPDDFRRVLEAQLAARRLG
ncbi:alpha/beta hydrolase [Cnuibacter physcomitrellae]|uniref:alpha/beta fold hydrolase n=1 Tax=Cnuibacter physcomitrellae TaxID=1619308 RepID=UPI0021757199|nr:alpha/beta hydrolase [Cnuibacter physcomitrellae]MCS5496026.1 alpha/beta hydrolase [Cnuibacter physcomitrellae]